MLGKRNPFSLAMQFEYGVVFQRCRIAVKVICHSVIGSKPVVLFLHANNLQVRRKVRSKKHSSFNFSHKCLKLIWLGS